MATFPYYDPIPKTAGRETQLSSATSAIDVAVREQVAAWLLQQQQGHSYEVSLYANEVLMGATTTTPTTGDEIRAYVVGRNLLELAAQGQDWTDAVALWINELGITTYDWNIGFNGSNAYGYVEGNYGTITPTTWPDSRIVSLFWNNTSGLFILRSPGSSTTRVSWNNKQTLTMNLEGYGDIVMTWAEASNDYRNSDAAVGTHVIANNGLNLDFHVTEGDVEIP